MSVTLTVNLTVLVTPCKKIGDYRITMLQLLTLTKLFFTQISIIHDSILLQNVGGKIYETNSA